VWEKAQHGIRNKEAELKSWVQRERKLEEEDELKTWGKAIWIM
jgi:hypothetical protein